jgi:hypothetical protein
VAQGTAGVNPVIVRSRGAKKRSGTLRTASWIASLPVEGVASPRRAMQPCVQPMASTAPGRDVVPNVPDRFGGIGARIIGADVAQGTADVAQETARVNPFIVRSRGAKKRSGTLRTASLPVDVVADCSSARDVRCTRAFNQWPVPLPGGTLSPTSLIFSAALALVQLGWTWRKEQRTWCKRQRE